MHDGYSRRVRRRVDREHVLVELRRSFRGASAKQLAEAANAIVALPDEWEEVPIDLRPPAGPVRHGPEFRIFRKRTLVPDVSLPEGRPGRFM